MKSLRLGAFALFLCAGVVGFPPAAASANPPSPGRSDGPDILIDGGPIVATAADFQLNGTIWAVFTTLADSWTYEYYSTDHGLTWYESGGSRADPGSPFDRLNHFAGAGDSAFYYYTFILYFGWGNVDRLDLIRTWVWPGGRDGTWFEDIIDPGTMHELAFCRDHTGDDYWLYGCVTDTLTTAPGRALRFLRSANFGYDWDAVDSSAEVVRMPHLACGAGSWVYFTGRGGAQGDSLLLWINQDRMHPDKWDRCAVFIGSDEIESPLVAAAFTMPESLATVWCVYSRNRDNSGNWDIEFVYSTDGGRSWSGPEILAGSLEAAERYPDLRNFPSPGDQSVTVSYVSVTGPDRAVYRRQATATEPGIWSDTLRLNQASVGTGRAVRPRLCFSPGGPFPGAGAVFVGADSAGCWWNAPYPGAVAEPRYRRSVEVSVVVEPSVGRGPFRIRCCAPAAKFEIRDLAGRLVRELPAGFEAVWDGSDGAGGRVPAGVHFISAPGSPGRGRAVVTD